MKTTLLILSLILLSSAHANGNYPLPYNCQQTVKLMSLSFPSLLKTESSWGPFTGEGYTEEEAKSELGPKVDSAIHECEAKAQKLSNYSWCFKSESGCTVYSPKFDIDDVFGHRPAQNEEDI